MNVKLLTEQNLEFLSINGGCTGSSESTLVKMPHCWKLRVTAQMDYCTGGKHGNKLQIQVTYFFQSTHPVTFEITPNGQNNILNKSENATPELFAIYIQKYANRECK